MQLITCKLEDMWLRIWWGSHKGEPDLDFPVAFDALENIVGSQNAEQLLAGEMVTCLVDL